MKKWNQFTLAAMIVLILSLAVCALALTPVRKTITLSGGSGSWTNDANYKVYKLKVVQFNGGLPAAATPNVKHVAGTVTNTVGTVTLSSGAGTFANTNTTYVFNGDMLLIDGSVTNDMSVQFILEAYPE